jgi:two-component system sensor histidine kinase HydH
MRRLQQEIARSRRLASIGSLAAGVAHEIRNPLSSIKGFATYFRERYRDNHEDAETAEVMIKEVDRLNRVITQLLDFARPMALDRTPVAPQILIRQALKMVEAQAGEKGITLAANLPADIGAVSLDADRIGQVLLNLCLNALAAMTAGGTLRLSLTQPEAGWIRIDVGDTGIGIPAEELSRVFDPYFTTKPAGTGLGLPIVQKIVEAHGGSIQLASDPGKGTTATLLLPAAPATPEEA